MKLSTKKFGLVFHIPTKLGHQEICRLESDNPFPVIQKDDLIDPRSWNDETFDVFTKDFNYGDLLKVETIYHHIIQNQDGSCGDHFIDIFTEIVKRVEN